MHWPEQNMVMERRMTDPKSWDLSKSSRSRLAMSKHNRLRPTIDFVLTLDGLSAENLDEQSLLRLS